MTTVPLSSPITVGEKTYSEFTFREAEAGDLMVAESVKGDMSQMIAVLACMADTPLPVFKKLKARDLKKIMKITADLMGEPEADTTGA